MKMMLYKEVLKVPNVIDNESIIFKKKINIIVYSISGVMGILFGLFFIPYFIIQYNLTLLSLNIVAFLFGVSSFAFLYSYTG